MDLEIAEVESNGSGDDGGRGTEAREDELMPAKGRRFGRDGVKGAQNKQR